MELDRERFRTIGWIAAALLVAVLAVRAVASGGGERGSVAVDPAPAEAGPAAVGGGGGGGGGGAGSVAVQVAGEVRRPGVYQVPAGARVYEAVERAGGLTGSADQAGVNLVAKVSDGQQVLVPRRGAAPVGAGSAGAGAAPGSGGGAAPGSGGGAASGSGGAAAAKVSLAAATPEQLDAIDGIGPTLARRIVEYRLANGGFSSIDELRQVDGIGEKRFEALRKAVTP